MKMFHFHLNLMHNTISSFAFYALLLYKDLIILYYEGGFSVLQFWLFFWIVFSVFVPKTLVFQFWWSLQFVDFPTATCRLQLGTEHCQSFFINTTSKLVTKLQATHNWLIQHSNRISKLSGLSLQMEMLD